MKLEKALPFLFSNGKIGETHHTKFPLRERSYSSLLKKGIHVLAAEAELDEIKLGEVDIIVSELVSNLLKHTDEGGDIYARVVTNGDNKGIEIIAIDSGRGMDTRKMLVDGVSTSETLGHGLGSIKRLSDEFDIYSIEGWGTIVFSRVWKKKLKKTEEKLYVKTGGFMLPKDGELTCGDGWKCHLNRKVLSVAVLDGLGHGPDAHQASEDALELFNKEYEILPNQLIRDVHSHIKRTRGIVGSFINIDIQEKRGAVCGVGNISGKIFLKNGESRQCSSYNGIIGHNIPHTLNNTEFADLDAVDVMIFCSDGIKSRWDIDKHAGLLTHHPVVIAAAIFKDFHRVTDDVLVVVIKNKTVRRFNRYFSKSKL